MHCGVEQSGGHADSPRILRILLASSVSTSASRALLALSCVFLLNPHRITVRDSAVAFVAHAMIASLGQPRINVAGSHPRRCKARIWQRHIRSASLASDANLQAAPGAAQVLSDVQDRNEFRRGVGLCVVNREGKVFAARRLDDSTGTWQMPQGGIDPMENPMKAALRELHEETGMTSVRIVASIDDWLDYEFPTKVRTPLGGQWVRYRGQTQKWFLLEFDGAEEDIDLLQHGQPEFSDWRWMHLEELPSAVVHFKRGVYERVARHFCPRIDLLLTLRASQRSRA